MTPAKISVTRAGVTLVWTGGRLADVVMPTKYDPEPHAVQCLQQPGWDTATFSFVRPPTRAELRVMLDRFLREDYLTFWENA